MSRVSAVEHDIDVGAPAFQHQIVDDRLNEERLLKMIRVQPAVSMSRFGMTSWRLSVWGWEENLRPSWFRQSARGWDDATRLQIFLDSRLFSGVHDDGGDPQTPVDILISERMDSWEWRGRGEVALVAQEDSNRKPERGRWPRAVFCRPKAATVGLVPDRDDWTSSSSFRARSRGGVLDSASFQRKADVFPAVRCMRRLNCWKIMPMLRRATICKLREPKRHMSLPSNMTLPPVAAQAC